MPEQQQRCEVCGWPLEKSAKEGCVPGNCSQLPAPKRESRTMRAQHDHLTVALNSARVMLDLPLDGDVCVGIGKLLDQYDAAVRDRDAAQVRVAELEAMGFAPTTGEAKVTDATETTETTTNYTDVLPVITDDRLRELQDTTRHGPVVVAIAIELARLRRTSVSTYMERQIEWSVRTFGVGHRTMGLIKHIGKELAEIEENPLDLMEWIDVMILAMDGFWRHGGTPELFASMLHLKQEKNFARTWPANMPESEPVEHDRSGEVRP
jgi:hypothetical protein